MDRVATGESESILAQGDSSYGNYAATGSCWQPCVDETSGYTYFWNTDTNQVSWEVPYGYPALFQPPPPPPPPPPNDDGHDKAMTEEGIELITSYGGDSSTSGSDEDDTAPPSKRRSLTKRRTCGAPRDGVLTPAVLRQFGPSLPPESPPPVPGLSPPPSSAKTSRPLSALLAAPPPPPTSGHPSPGSGASPDRDATPASGSSTPASTGETAVEDELMQLLNAKAALLRELAAAGENGEQLPAAEEPWSDDKPLGDVDQTLSPASEEAVVQSVSPSGQKAVEAPANAAKRISQSRKRRREARSRAGKSGLIIDPPARAIHQFPPGQTGDAAETIEAGTPSVEECVAPVSVVGADDDKSMSPAVQQLASVDGSSAESDDAVLDVMSAIENEVPPDDPSMASPSRSVASSTSAHIEDSAAVSAEGDPVLDIMAAIESEVPPDHLPDEQVIDILSAIESEVPPDYEPSSKPVSLVSYVRSPEHSGVITFEKRHEKRAKKASDDDCNDSVSDLQVKPKVCNIISADYLSSEEDDTHDETLLAKPDINGEVSQPQKCAGGPDISEMLVSAVPADSDEAEAETVTTSLSSCVPPPSDHQHEIDVPTRTDDDTEPEEGAGTSSDSQSESDVEMKADEPSTSSVYPEEAEPAATKEVSDMDSAEQIATAGNTSSGRYQTEAGSESEAKLGSKAAGDAHEIADCSDRSSDGSTLKSDALKHVSGEKEPNSGSVVVADESVEPAEKTKLNIRKVRRSSSSTHRRSIPGMGLIAAYGSDSESETDEEEETEGVMSPPPTPPTLDQVAGPVERASLFPAATAVDSELRLEAKAGPSFPSVSGDASSSAPRRTATGSTSYTTFSAYHLPAVSTVQDGTRIGLGFSAPVDAGEDAPSVNGHELSRRGQKTKRSAPSCGPVQFLRGETLVPATVDDAVVYSASAAPGAAKTESSPEDAELKGQIDELLEVVVDKLEFLGVVNEDVSPLKIQAIQCETLCSAWTRGALSSSYLLSWLRAQSDSLVVRELESAPPGWGICWNRQRKYYQYTEQSSGRVTCQFPVEAVAEEELDDVSSAAAATSSLPVHTVEPPPPGWQETHPPSPPPPPPAASSDPPEPPPPGVCFGPSLPAPPAPKISPPSPPPPPFLSQPTPQLLSQLDSFYSEVGLLGDEGVQEASSVVEKPPAQQQPVVEKVPAQQPAPASLQPTVTSILKKRKKTTKLNSGLALKKKGVDQMVAKWKTVQKQLR